MQQGKARGARAGANLDLEDLGRDALAVCMLPGGLVQGHNHGILHPSPLDVLHPGVQHVAHPRVVLVADGHHHLVVDGYLHITAMLKGGQGLVA